MNFKPPKFKNHSTSCKKFNLPPQNKNPIMGIFNGENVKVLDWDSMNCIYEGGIFGKGNLSKSAPHYHVKKDDIPRIIFQNQLECLSKWDESVQYSCPKKYSGHSINILELSNYSVNNFLKSSYLVDSHEAWICWKKLTKGDYKEKEKSRIDQQALAFLELKNDEENFIDTTFSQMVNDILRPENKKKMDTPKQKIEEEVMVINTSLHSEISDPGFSVKIKKLPYLAEENLYLNLEEAFFLKFVTGCLNIVDLKFTELSLPVLWEKFEASQKNFKERYVIYHYYRAKGWVVKSGLKFGGDYLLYKQGPSLYHASYLIQVLDRRKKISWREFIALNRLVETFNKDLILCKVKSKKTSIINDNIFPHLIKNYAVEQVMSRRWFPSKERLTKD